MADEKYTPRLKELYYASVRDALKEKFGYTNVNPVSYTHLRAHET